MADSTTIWNKASSGKYEPSQPYPSKPSRPDLLNKKVKDLTGDELEQISQTKEAYDLALAEYEAGRKEYRAETDRLIEKLRADLEEEYGVTDNPKAKKLWELAWDRGHFNGLTDVINMYDDFVELIL